MTLLMGVVADLQVPQALLQVVPQDLLQVALPATAVALQDPQVPQEVVVFQL